jgi:dTDP-4-dehydrorhamnose reductase
MESIWDLCELGVTGTFNVASSNSLSKFEFGVGVAKRFGLDAGLISKLGPVEGSHIISRARDLSLDTTLVSTALGRPMPTQERGIDQAAIDEPLLTQTLRHE